MNEFEKDTQPDSDWGIRSSTEFKISKGKQRAWISDHFYEDPDKVREYALGQSYSLTKINEFLHSLIGKNIVSKMHTARQLKVKYIKPNTGGIMCFQEHSKKWKFVYYNQIKDVL